MPNATMKMISIMVALQMDFWKPPGLWKPPGEGRGEKQNVFSETGPGSVAAPSAALSVCRRSPLAYLGLELGWRKPRGFLLDDTPDCRLRAGDSGPPVTCPVACPPYGYAVLLRPRARRGPGLFSTPLPVIWRHPWRG